MISVLVASAKMTTSPAGAKYGGSVQGVRYLVNAAAPLGALVSGGVKGNGPALCRCSAFLAGFALPNLPLCIGTGFGVANVPQHLWLG